ncbi:hypothetical protein MNBD_DELTA03-114, partial [hydrothermal vent metagenome]
MLKISDFLIPLLTLLILPTA